MNLILLGDVIAGRRGAVQEWTREKVMSSVYLPDTLTKLDETQPSLSLEVKGASMRLDSLTVWPMRSIWPE